MFIYSKITGFYGSGYTKTTVFTYLDFDGGTWYVCTGASLVNYTYDDVADGVNVEELADVDCFTWSEGITSLTQFQKVIEINNL
jgi:hypothetical protein